MSCQEYRVFLEEFHTDEDILTIKVGSYRLTESEILGEVINWTLQYLSENKCPTKLSAPITKNVVETIQSEKRKDRQLCGYDEHTKTFDPSKLKNLVILSLKTFCQRLLDNVELNKILPELNGKDYTPVYTTGAIRNKRRFMEDRHICIHDFNETYSIPNATKANFYAVFDGHDGNHAAFYSVAQLPYLLATSPLYPLNPAEAMRQSFRSTDSAFVQKTYQQSLRGGTTAVCALYLLEESRLYVGWVGDSKALLAKQGKIMQIVKPHKPEDPMEMKRIKAAGGIVMQWGGMWRVDGVLNLSRAIGNSKCKPHVIADPDIVGLELDKNEDFLVLACDGLWDYVPEDKVAEIIYQQLRDDSENLNKIPQKLIEKSKQEGSSDNISIVIVFLKDPYKIVKNICTIEIMEPAFDNCNIGEFNNSEQVLSTNANTTQNDFMADQSKEFFDDHQLQKQNTNSKELLQQFNDGLNNFLQDPNNICTNMMTNLNNQFELKNSFEQINDDGRQQFDENFLNDFTKSTITAVNDNVIDELTKGETPTDFEQEACIDVTDEIAMVTTENSEHSTISHSKDTLPLSDNFNPFDNKMSFENRNDYNEGDNIGFLCDENDDTKSTPMISPDSEEIMNQGSDDMNDLISPEYEQPIVDELASGGDMLKQADTSESEMLHQNQQDFDNNFIQTNGHMSPEKHIVSDEEDIFQQQHIPEAIPDSLKDMGHHNEDTHQNEFVNVNYNHESEPQNEIFGLNSIKENHFESNYAEGNYDLDHNNQHIILDAEKHSDMPSDNFDENVEEIVEETFNKTFSENNVNSNCMSDDNQDQVIEHNIEPQIELDTEQQIDPEITQQNEVEKEELINPEIELKNEPEREELIDPEMEHHNEPQREELIDSEIKQQNEPERELFDSEIDQRNDPEREELIDPEIEQQNEPEREKLIDPEIEQRNEPEREELIDPEIEHHNEPQREELIDSEIKQQNEPERELFDSEIDQRNDPEREQLIDPERDQLIDPEIEQQNEPEREQLIDPKIEQEIDPKIEQEIEPERQELIDSERKEPIESEIDQQIDHQGQEQEIECDKEPVCEKKIEPDFIEVTPIDMKANEDFNINDVEQHEHLESEIQNTENYSIPTDNFGEQKMELTEEQLQEPEEQQHLQENFEEDGFAEQEFAEHDTFDERNMDQSGVPQNLSIEADIERNPVTELSSQQDERLECCDESEDEWKYMRLKEGEGEKDIKKIELLNEIDNREQEIIDLTTSSNELIVETTEIDNSTDFQHNSKEENQSTKISLEEPKELSNQSQQQEILSSSPKSIAINLNITPIATDLDDDMNYQLNPEAKEFIPLSPPIATGNIFLEGDNNNGLILNGDGLLKMTQQQQHQHLVGDDVVAQSPKKCSAINMDEIYVPDQSEFDIEVRHRPHEIIESAEKLSDSTVAAIEEIIVGDSNNDVQQELYQELNLKEAMHGSEKDEHILSPTDLDVCDQTGITNPIFNPVAEFENIDMKDSIYIEKSSSNNIQEQQKQNDEFETNQDILNRVQLLPDWKEELVSNENDNEKDIVSPIVVPVNGVSSQENNEKLNNITDDLNILKLSSNDTSINESPNQNTIGIDLETAAGAAVAIAATTIAAAGVTAATILPTADDKKIKAKVAEKNLKNKMIKSPKVPEKKLSATSTTTAATLTKTSTTSSASSAQPKKIVSKTSVISANKPKTLTVATAPTPKTLTFVRPRTAPANITAATAKNGTNTGGGGGAAATTITKLRNDTSKPAPIKKPTPNKTSATIETVKSNFSKTGVSAKSSVTSRISATTNPISKPRPASATTNGSAANGTTKTTTNLLRPASVKNTAKPPLSPRGTYTSTLRKTEAIKSPTKSTTTTTSTTTTSRVTTKGPTSATTTRTTATTASKLSGTVRKSTTGTTTNTSLSGKSLNAGIGGAKKITPIKNPTAIKKEIIEKLPAPIKKPINTNGTSSVIVTNNSIITEQPKGITPPATD